MLGFRLEEPLGSSSFSQSFNYAVDNIGRELGGIHRWTALAPAPEDGDIPVALYWHLFLSPTPGTFDTETFRLS